jgi:phosphoserine phosphatase
LLEGLSAGALTAVADRLQLNPGAEVLLKNLKYLGFKTAIISGGFTFFARHLQSRLDIDYVYANHLDIAAGAVTGKVVGEIIDGQRKAQILTEIARREGLAVKQVVAVGDGANDLPMLGIAGLGIAYRAKPRVRAEAKQAISNNSLAAVLCILGYSEEDLL